MYDKLVNNLINIYPFAEGLAGILMVADILHYISISITLFIGIIGTVSVFKAVYIDKIELKCACVEVLVIYL